jgi:hypothetical protein
MIQKLVPKKAGREPVVDALPFEPALRRQQQTVQCDDLLEPESELIPVLCLLAVAHDPTFRAARHHAVEGQDVIPDRNRRIIGCRDSGQKIEGADEVRLEHPPTTRQVTRLRVTGTIEATPGCALMLEDGDPITRHSAVADQENRRG